MENITIYGVPLSPFVRKVRIAMAMKNISYDLVPVIPFGAPVPPEFAENSPLGKIPLLKVGERFLPDSSVICQYLERAQPAQAILPSDPYDAARALWFEEYADGHMTAVIGGHLFIERVLAPVLFNREPNQEDIDKAINEELPDIFNYLEGELSQDYLVGDSMTLADVAVASVFVNMMHAQHSCDASRWPKTAAYIKRMHSSEMFAELIAAEQQIMASMAG